MVRRSHCWKTGEPRQPVGTFILLGQVLYLYLTQAGVQGQADVKKFCREIDMNMLSSLFLSGTQRQKDKVKKKKSREERGKEREKKRRREEKERGKGNRKIE